MSEETLLEQNTPKYGILFDLLRRSSTETDIITNRILQDAKGSLLDIGANDGLITQKLIPHFNRTVAIERTESEMYVLNTLGIETHNCLWEDFESNEKFDRILASHIIYYFTNNSIEQCKKMQDYLNPNGKAFIIYNAHQNEHSEFMNTFYPELHNGVSPFEHTKNLEKKLKHANINCEKETLAFQIEYLNEAHFQGLASFFIDHEIQDSTELSKEIKNYYRTKLEPKNQTGIKKMNVDLDFITIYAEK